MEWKEIVGAYRSSFQATVDSHILLVCGIENVRIFRLKFEIPSSIDRLLSLIAILEL
jgi:hypothetical protein